MAAAETIQGTRSACVLVVEDEALIRWSVVSALEDAGYDTIEAGSGDAALEFLDAVDFVFTDVRMPGQVDGLELARLVRRDHPSVHVLVTSGHVTVGALGGEFPVVSKPYDPDRIVDYVAATLAAG